MAALKIAGFSILTIIGIAMIAIGGFALYSSRVMLPGPTKTTQDTTWGTVTAVGIVLVLGSIYKLF